METAVTTTEKPGFDELMLAMDAVDTIRHETSAMEAELSGDERRDVLKARLREYYAGQGIEVPDEVLEEAVEGVGRDRFVFKPLEPGLARTLATAWVRRGTIARRTAWTLGGAVVSAWLATTAHHHLVVAPRERAAIERQEDLATRLPVALDKAYQEAAAAAAEYGDEAAAALAANRRDAAARLIEGGDRDGARSAVTEIERLGSDIRSKIAVAALMEKARTVVEAARAKGFDTRAAAGMEPLLKEVERAAASGSDFHLARAEQELADFIEKVETPFGIRIVDRDGVRSGVWRTNDGGKTRVYYLVVEAIDPAGRPVPMEIRNWETGKTGTVEYWGVRVPQSEYERVAADKTSDGVIDRPEAGRKPSGSLDIVWDIPAGEQTITEW